MISLKAGRTFESHLVGEPFKHHHGDFVSLAHEEKEEARVILDRSRELSLPIEEFSSGDLEIEIRLSVHEVNRNIIP